MGSICGELKSVAVPHGARLPLQALDTLIDAEHGTDPASIISALQELIAFDQAVVLAISKDGVHCEAALPAALSDLPWSGGALFNEVAAGRIFTTCGPHDSEEWKRVACDFLQAAQPALYLPIRIREHPGLIILLRGLEQDPFGESDIALGREFTLLALAASASRTATSIEAEVARLGLLVEQLRQSEAESRRLNDLLQKRAYTDELTGLANRTRLEEYVEALLRSSPPGCFALACIQLQNFKHINDYYTSPVGDELLRRVAHRIAVIARGSDVLARTGSDEFGLLLQNNDAQLHASIARLAEQLREPFHIDGFEIFTSASIGVSIFPEHGRSYEELRRNAESALYRAQNSAVGTAVFFDASMHQSRQARMQLEQRLRLAIRDMQFRCAFQPKVDIRTRDVIGFETLIRWCDDHGEIQSPQGFINLAAELGVINPITRFVLSEAIESIGALDEAYGPDKTISINVAAKQAGDVNFMRGLLDTLAQSGFAERFIIEVTEDAFIATREFQAQILPMLRELGVRVSIDDFGTAIPPCRCLPISPPTKSRSTVPSSATSTSAHAAKAFCGRSNR
jgi:cyclic di-GMP phosphodiesterase Gmr